MNFEPEELYGKRKKRKLACPNPLFELWLTEWRDEAATKGWKSQYNYGKALTTLKRFPLPLSNGKECKMLKNFGDKTCNMLDIKLSEHLSVHGTTAPVSITSTMTTSKASLSSTNQNSFSSGVLTSAVSNNEVTIVDSSDSENGENLINIPKKRRKSSGSNEYIPAFRSGSYAILLSLYKDRQDAQCKGYLTKTQLINLAQPLADKSFTEPDPGNAQWYTAWSSMATLIKKGLVIKERSPAQFSLTETGCNIAQRLQSVNENSTFNNTPPVAKKPDILSQPSGSANQETESKVSSQSTLPSNIDSNRLRYWYITEDNQEVLFKDEASVTVDDDFGIGFLVKVNYEKLIMSGKTYSLYLKRPLGKDVFAYLADADAEDIAVNDIVVNKTLKPNSIPSSSATSFPASSAISSSSSLSITKTTKPNKEAKAVNSKQRKLKSPTRAVTSLAAGSMLADSTTIPHLPSTHTDRSATAATYSNTRVTHLDVDSSSQTSAASSITSTVSSTSSLPVPEFVLRPGQFEIILCIDNREFYGSSKSRSKLLLPDLLKNGVKCDLRELHVGDLLWVAKETVSSMPGELQSGISRELVLDFIVERKRMDDLVGSMVDGRLQDQKFRLKRCGVKNAIFLIENYGSMKNFSLGEDRIKQAISNTQVIDGFTVKRVNDTKETVVYLTIMTRYLQKYYNNKILHACSPDVIKDLHKAFDINDHEHYLMPFQNFNLGSIKSKALSVREMFGKQLIQLHGMSADKAKAIIDIYPTPSHLLEAYDRCITTKERENLLSGIKCGKLTRNLGIAQSKQIATLYYTSKPLT